MRNQFAVWNPVSDLDVTATCRFSGIGSPSLRPIDFAGRIRPWFTRVYRRALGQSHHYGLDDLMTIQSRFNFRPGFMPRIFLRIDDFTVRNSLDSYDTFHRLLWEKQCPYLLGVTPFPSGVPMPDEHLNYLRSIAGQAAIALHGITHQYRSRKPRSEMTGIDPRELTRDLSRAQAYLGHASPFFIPPFNTIDRALVPLLTDHFRVISSGPEMIALHGPVWPALVINKCVILYSSFPFYGSASEILSALGAIDLSAIRFPVCVTLHFPVEEDREFRDLKELLDVIKPWVRDWTELILS